MESDPPFVKEIDAKAKAGHGSSTYKEMALYLQAMRSVICANQCPPSATAYFAATVTTLQKCAQQRSAPEFNATVSPLLLLLRRAMTAASATVVSSRFNDVALVLAAVLSDAKEDVAKQVLGCLMVAADAAFNAGSRPNRKALKPVFASLGDQRMLVRRQAELTATLILKRASSVSDQQTIDFASQHLAQIIGETRTDKKSPDDLPVQHVITLLRAMAPMFPMENLSVVSAALLKLPVVLGQHPCCTSAFEFFATQFDEASAGGAERAAALAVKLLPGLLDVPVKLLNVAYVVAHARALGAAVAALTGKAACAALPPGMGKAKVRAVQKLLKIFTERDPTLLRGTREACVKVFTTAGANGDFTLLDSVLEACLPLLGYESKGAWPHALPVIAGLFDALGAIRAGVAPAEVPAWTGACFERARALALELVGIRDKAYGSELNVFGTELTQCFGSMVATFGPELVLSVAGLGLLEHPFNDPRYEQHSRSWLLLVLKDSCRRTSLAFFASYFLPLASALKVRAATAEKTTSSIEAKKYMILLEQVWAVLPAMCNEPLDLTSAMFADGGKLAKQLVAVFVNESQLRDHVMMAFTRICDAVHEPPSPLSAALLEPNRACLKTLSARVMPEMFNAYLKAHAESEELDTSNAGYKRNLALGAIQGYARIAEPELLGTLFKTLVARLLKATTGQAGAADVAGGVGQADLPQAAPLADIANSLVPYLPVELLELVLKVFTPMLNGGALGPDEDRGVAATLQKAAYRVMRSVIEHPSTGDSKVWNPGKVLGIWALLRDARQTCTLPALKARLIAIKAVVLLMQQNFAPRFMEAAVRQEFLQCLSAILPEVLLHLRDPGTTTREAARDCLHVAATTAIHQDMQAEVVTLLSAGLAGLTPQSKALAVDALSRLLYEHSTNMAQGLQDRLIRVILLLFADSDAQVWRAVLKFSKVVVVVLPKENLQGFLPEVLKLFVSKYVASAQMLIRSIIERLVKVLPFASLLEAFPKAHLPLLHYVQRQLARQQRPKGVREAKPGEDEEEDAKDKQGEGEEDGEEEDAQMEDTGGGQKQSWDEFHQEIDGDKKAPGSTAQATGRKKRARADDAGKGAVEPPTSVVMQHEAVQALLDAWEAESDDDGGSAKQRGQAKNKRKHEAVEASTWIHEDKDVPLDFMSADAAHSVLTERPRNLKRRRGTAFGASGAENRADALRRNGLRFSDDGRLVVAEDEPDAGAKDEGDASKAKKFTIGTDSSKKLKPLSRLAEQRKLRVAAKARVRLERRGAHTLKGLDDFKPGGKKSLRGQGDATRKGSALKPYAYVQLNPKVMKEKFKDRATRSFSAVVKGAKKGVKKGNKSKAIELKLRAVKDKQRKKHGRSRK